MTADLTIGEELALDGLGQDLARSLRGFPSEEALQSAIAAALAARGVPFEREVSLSRADRIDFVVLGRVGLEVKVGGALAAVTRQLHRYAQSERLAALMLVTTRTRHLAVPSSLNGKHVWKVHLIGGAL